ncbi:hypothetical protein COB21_02255 [Candidatus Aerophobetes bacterium]|uniref:Uncharacterized protein n=1 Tax=Aerophobetes bacterium TaxID=2030807 RepID=A0A2A4X718_UNCAE|nr:MAG: hypothetical protein COB21_02255 [Candidatus Aerophobetes bacterium]
MNPLEQRYIDLVDQTLNFLRGENNTTKTPTVSPIPQTFPKKAAVSVSAPVSAPVSTPAKKALPPAPQVEPKPKTKPEAQPILKETVKPAPIQPAAAPQPVSPSPIKLMPQTEPPTLSSSDSFLTFMQRNFPHNRLHRKPQEDQQAKSIRFGWQDRKQLSEVVLLYDNSLLVYKPFLENIARAISLIFKPSSLVNINSLQSGNVWQTLTENEQIQLILAPDSLLSANQPPLLSDSSGASLLGTHPLLELPDLSLYQKDPLLKRSLWEMICQKLRKN